MADLTAFKGSMICIIFLSGLLGVLSPRLFKPYSSRLSYASLFSSGILMSAAIVHLLGDAVEGLSDSPLPAPDFPWGYFLCGLSFYCLYFFERYVIHLLAHNHDHNNGDETRKNPTPDQDEQNPMQDAVDSDKDQPEFIVKKDDNHSLDVIDDIQTLFNDKSNTENHGEDILLLMRRKNIVAAFVLLIGLGLHSFLAGIGFEASEDIDTAADLSIAIISHKYLAAFTLGCPFYKSGESLRRQLIIGLCFSIITPFGIGIGWALSEGLDLWVSDVFISITAGAFIYVAIVEILIPEFSDNGHDNKSSLVVKTECKGEETDKNEEEVRAKWIELMKGLSVFSGFLLMSMLALWV